MKERVNSFKCETFSSLIIQGKVPTNSKLKRNGKCIKISQINNGTILIL